MTQNIHSLMGRSLDAANIVGFVLASHINEIYTDMYANGNINKGTYIDGMLILQRCVFRIKGAKITAGAVGDESLMVITNRRELVTVESMVVEVLAPLVSEQVINALQPDLVTAISITINRLSKYGTLFHPSNASSYFVNTKVTHAPVYNKRILRITSGISDVISGKVVVIAINTMIESEEKSYSLPLIFSEIDENLDKLADDELIGGDALLEAFSSLMLIYAMSGAYPLNDKQSFNGKYTINEAIHALSDMIPSDASKSISMNVFAKKTEILEEMAPYQYYQYGDIEELVESLEEEMTKEEVKTLFEALDKVMAKDAACVVLSALLNIYSGRDLKLSTLSVANNCRYLLPGNSKINLVGEYLAIDEQVFNMTLFLAATESLPRDIVR